MGDALAEMLFQSSFATLAESRRFIEWYERTEYTSGWDDLRYTEALALTHFQPAEATRAD